MFKRRKALSDITELNMLLAAGEAERIRLVGEMSESVVKGLLVYVLGKVNPE